MTQEQVVQAMKDAMAQAQANNLKSLLQAMITDGGAMDQQKQLELEADPAQADLIVAHYNKVKATLATIAAAL